MKLGKAYWRNFDKGIEKEWLLTNGLGGFSSSTIIGANSRRYHGLLIASLNPPVERHLILSQISERIALNGEDHYLHSFRTPDFTGLGFKYLESFSYKYIPQYNYRIEDLFIKKSITMEYGKNVVYIVYEIDNGENTAEISLSPLINYRNHHYTSRSKYMDFNIETEENSIVINPYSSEHKIRVYYDSGVFINMTSCFFYSMEYEYEKERGLDAIDDHLISGIIKLEIQTN